MSGTPLRRQRPSFTIYRDEPTPATVNAPPLSSPPAQSSSFPSKTPLSQPSKENSTPYALKHAKSPKSPLGISSSSSSRHGLKSQQIQRLPSIHETLSSTPSLGDIPAKPITRSALATKYVHPNSNSPSKSKSKSGSTSSKKSSVSKVKSSSRKASKLKEQGKSVDMPAVSEELAVGVAGPSATAKMTDTCAKDVSTSTATNQLPLRDISAAFDTGDVPEGYVGHYAGRGKKRSRAHTITSRDDIPSVTEEECEPTQPESVGQYHASQETVVVSSSSLTIDTSNATLVAVSAPSQSSPHKRVRLSSEPAPDYSPRATEKPLRGLSI